MRFCFVPICSLKKRRAANLGSLPTASWQFSQIVKKSAPSLLAGGKVINSAAPVGADAVRTRTHMGKALLFFLSRAEAEERRRATGHARASKSTVHDMFDRLAFEFNLTGDKFDPSTEVPPLH